MRKIRTDLLEGTDAARILGVTPGLVRQLAREKKILPCIVTRRGLRLYEPREVARVAKLRAKVAAKRAAKRAAA